SHVTKWGGKMRQIRPPRVVKTLASRAGRAASMVRARPAPAAAALPLPGRGGSMPATRVAVGGLVVRRRSSASADAQTMRDALNRLFVFSSGSDPLFLGGSAGIPSTQVHGDHFIPSESEANGAVLEFFNAAIASNIAHFPLGSTVSSQTFVFQGGVPTPTSGSFGPIFSERAPTLGRGRFNAGLS